MPQFSNRLHVFVAVASVLGFAPESRCSPPMETRAVVAA